LLISIERATADLTVLDRGAFQGVGFSPDGRSLVYSRTRRSAACGDSGDLHVAASTAVADGG
jgi:hypothetical protein